MSVQKSRKRKVHGILRNRLTKLKNQGFGGDVNPNWSFPKGNFFKNNEWGKNLYENEKKEKIKKKKEKFNLKTPGKGKSM